MGIESKPPRETPGQDREISEQREQRLAYISTSNWTKKVHALGGRTRDIVPGELRAIIGESQPKTREWSSDLSDEEWNRAMEARQKANEEMEVWVRKEARRQGIVWIGDWKHGERPGGYVRTQERYKSLHDQGFSATEVLGKDWVRENNEIIKLAEKGLLTQEQLDKLLENNRRLNEAMDEFERGPK